MIAESLCPGDWLDRYELITCVGQGGMGAIWLARVQGKRGFEKLVAIKTIRSEYSDDPQFEAMFLDEARIASRVHHHNVAQIIDLGEHNGVLHLVMEWVDGESLGRLKQEAEKLGTTLPLPIVLRVLADTCQGLHAAHELTDENGEPLGVVHRDVSLHNILVTKTGGAKLIDFGIAKGGQRLSEETCAGGLRGKPAYMSREQLAGEEIDRRADTWAIGICLYALATGTFPFENCDPLQLLERLRSGEPAPVPNVAWPVQSILEKALAIDPEQRFQTADALGRAMEEALVELGTPTTSSDVARFLKDHLARTPSTRRSRVASSVASISVGSVGAVGAKAVARSSSTNRTSANTPSSIRTPHPSLTPSGTVVDHTPAGEVTRPTPSSRRGWVMTGALLAAMTLASAHWFSQSQSRAQSQSQLRSTVVAPHSETLEKGASARAKSAESTTAGSGGAPSPQVASVSCPAEMAFVPAKQFFMGSDEGDTEEKPAHNVQLSGYCMDRTEVTVASYQRCSNEGKCKRAGTVVDWPELGAHDAKVYSPLCNANAASTKGDHPVNCINWEMANTYCAVEGKRLPTEAEWEYAARGPDGRVYPWGDEAPDASRLNACGPECVTWGANAGESFHAMYKQSDGFPTTAPVGSFPKGASPFGLLDVVGNVWEWTADVHAAYSADAQVDPKGPEHGRERVVRGGAWNGAYASWVRPTQRYSFPPTTKSHAVGFRCARDAAP